ncbi:HAMP domain-containing histidine kinase [Polaribacter batillariae]|uniref:histidine kinase n=1 Tax=Polaribacter batillariae TaxID=2808900 RepID=A0ABX7SVU9_9FLAO|nr:HAMP domain-containing sensor histidine kinase [Polaribacter batillariae]QTD38379.1 HAMP domain-containing histidine kinase [Polaribacter batillariae]
MSKKTKLIKKTSKSFLITGFILIVLSSIILYFYTRNLLQNEIEESLYSTEARVVFAIENNKIQFSLPPVTEIKKVNKLKRKILKDTVIYDASQDEMELFRELTTFKNINGENYQITVRNLVVESENILLGIVISNFAIFLISFIFLYYLNTSRNLKLWKPFFKNLEQMKQFSLTSKKPIQLIESDVLEFSELKMQIETLTQKVQTDYENLKQFTEDVSHEMQTPLAIIQAKIDNIINAHEINDKQFKQITSIQKDIQRLKQLNKRITILTKIDNNQYINVSSIHLTHLINDKIDSYKGLNINNISCNSTEVLMVSMDSYLADILINNLFSNAIKYSRKKDKILINTTKNSLTISNIGDKALVDPEKLFNRFYRESNKNYATGLGLAIVKKICDLYQFKISYQFKANHHIFSIEF